MLLDNLTFVHISSFLRLIYKRYTALLKQEGNQRSLLQARLQIERKLIADEKSAKAGKGRDRQAAIAVARMQPKSPEEETVIAEKYGKMDLEERAFTILVDLGMIVPSQDPDSMDYDKSIDSDLAIENRWL